MVGLIIGNTISVSGGMPSSGGGNTETRFIITVKTDNSGTSADNQFTLPWIGTYDVDWGDGTSDSGVTDAQTHTYATAGTYDVAVTAETGRIFFSNFNINAGDRKKLVEIKNWGSCAWTSMERAFRGCTNLINVDSNSIPNFSNPVSTTRYMFFGCNSLTSLSVNGWDISGLSDFEGMFAGMTSLEEIVGLEAFIFTVPNNMNGFKQMFQSSPNANFNVSNWVLPLNARCERMFDNCDSFDRNLSNWNVENVTNFNGFISNSNGLSTSNYDSTLIGWEQSLQNAYPNGAGYPHNISINFGGSKYSYEARQARQSLIDTFGWTIVDGGEAVRDEFALRWETTTDNEEIQIGVGDGTFDYTIDWGDGTVENYTTNDNISHTYATSGSYITKITGTFPHINMGDASVSQTFKDKLYEIVNWGNIAFESLNSAFNGCSNIDMLNVINPPNLSNCTDIRDCFRLCLFLGNINGGNIDLSSWDVSNVLNFQGFYLAYNDYNLNISGWNINPNANIVMNISIVQNLDVSNMNFGTRTSLSNMFWLDGVTSFIGLDTWDVSNINNFSRLFGRSSTLQSGLDGIIDWNFQDGCSFASFFYALSGTDCASSANEISIKPSDVSSCFGYSNHPNTLSNLNLNNWDMSLCTNVKSMFRNTAQFQKDLFSTWDITNISNFTSFFNDAQGLLRENYDATLIAWEATLQATYPNGASYPYNISITFGNSQYTLGGQAETARQSLIDNFGWTIVDGGGI